MKLISIGFIGSKSVYVDISKEDAIKRFNIENPDFTVEENNISVDEIEVKNGRFAAYEIWDAE